MDRQFLCIRWGTKYGPDYLHRLHRMIARHTTPPWTLWCMTDDPASLPDGVRPLPLLDLGCAPPTGTFGIWGKSRIWAEDLSGGRGDGPRGPVLFMDLDLVVTGSLDGFFTHGRPDDVILARNWNTPLEKLGQTSLFRYPVGKLAPLRAMFQADPQGIADRYRFEQRFVTRNAPGGVSFWPYGWVRHFKLDCVPPFPLSLARAPRLPRGTKVVIFPGTMNPPDAIAGRWDAASTPRAPMDHVRYALSGQSPKGRWRALRQYNRPAPWVADHWSA